MIGNGPVLFGKIKDNFFNSVNVILEWGGFSNCTLYIQKVLKYLRQIPSPPKGSLKTLPPPPFFLAIFKAVSFPSVLYV